MYVWPDPTSTAFCPDMSSLILPWLKLEDFTPANHDDFDCQREKECQE